MKNIIAAHICERNAVMGSVSAIIVFIIIIAACLSRALTACLYT